jgi:hypothetical protein
VLPAIPEYICCARRPARRYKDSHLHREAAA